MSYTTNNNVGVDKQVAIRYQGKSKSFRAPTSVLDDDDMALVEDDIPHPGIASEVLGVDLASETPGVSPSDTHDDSAIDIYEPIQEQLVESVVHNNSLSIAGPYKTPGVPLVNIPDDDTMIDLTNSSQECKVIPKREPKARFEIEDDESVEDDNNPDEDQFGEALVAPDDIRAHAKQNLARAENLGSSTNEDGLRRSNRTIRPPQFTQVSLQNKRYDIDGWNEIVHGTNHMNVDAWNRGGKVSGNKYVEGSMHVNVQDPVLFMYDEAEALEETMGVEMAQHFSIRAGLRKVCSKGEKAVRNEITQLHTISNY